MFGRKVVCESPSVETQGNSKIAKTQHIQDQRRPFANMALFNILGARRKDVLQIPNVSLAKLVPR